jgi:membrane fusion protein (multidrug efflux system)
MGKKIIIGIMLIALAIFGLYRVAIWKPKVDPKRQNVTLVKVDQPKRETIEYVVKLTGDIMPIQQASIYSKVGGNLEQEFVNIGDYVREGQLLAIIDTTLLAQQVEQAYATYMNDSLQYVRSQKLYEDTLAAETDLENAQTTFKVAQANYNDARTQLEYAHITAPFAGFITKRYFDPGALVNPDNSILFDLMNIDKMKSIANILEGDISLVSDKTEAIITVDAFPGKQFRGLVARMSDAVDLTTRTMAVEIDIPNPEHLLKPGMFGNVTLILAEHSNALTVPTDAVLKDGVGEFVLVESGNVARRKDVKIGGEQNSRTEIVSGLADTDTVITTGQQFARDGAAVRIQEQ